MHDFEDINVQRGECKKQVGIGGVLFFEPKGVFYYLYGQILIKKLKSGEVASMGEYDDTLVGFEGTYRKVNDEIVLSYKYILNKNERRPLFPKDVKDKLMRENTSTLNIKGQTLNIVKAFVYGDFKHPFKLDRNMKFHFSKKIMKQYFSKDIKK